MAIVHKDGSVDRFSLILSRRNLIHLGELTNISDLKYTRNLNSADEISFTITKQVDDYVETLWDEIYSLRLVWVKQLNEYFQINVTLDETLSDVLSVVGTSLCEAELSQTLLFDIEINTENDLATDGIGTTFYNSKDKSHSLLHRILDKNPNYSIGHVDASLAALTKIATFTISGTSVYDFLTGECATEYGCLFTFDSTTRKINAYDLMVVCKECGYRGEYSHVCPECGSTDLSYYGEDTTIYVSTENLTDQITYDTDVDSIKNCFRLEAGDEFMTATIKNCNPNGSAYIYYFSDETKRDMTPELVAKLDEYNELYNSLQDAYNGYLEGYYDATNKVVYYESSMMPTPSTGHITATTEGEKLTVKNLSPIAVASLTSGTSLTTVNNALLTYAKIIVKSGYVKVEIDNGATYNASTHMWRGKFTVTSYNDAEDVYHTPLMTITVTGDYEKFINQKVIKTISTKGQEEDYEVLSITDNNLLTEEVKKYSYNRLKSFFDAYNGGITVLASAGLMEDTSTPYYSSVVQPYLDRINIIYREMVDRQETVDEWVSKAEENFEGMRGIQEQLVLEGFLGEELYKEFLNYRREDTYSNANYISDGLDDAKLIERAREFITEAQKEVVKSGEQQHSISSDLNNLLLIPEFEPILDYFEVGNWIWFRVDDNLFRLRLISYTIDFNSLSKISTTFSDLTKGFNAVSDMQSVLNQASAMATSYNAITRQANEGQDAYVFYNTMLEEGLSSALVNIKSNTNEEITYDRYGILAKSYDDITEQYSPEQLRITSNIMAFTDDNWKTVTTALGKHDYTYYDEDEKKYAKGTDYGLSAKFVTAGYISGTQIIGGSIYSQNYSDISGSFIDLNSGYFNFAGGQIVNDENGFRISQMGTVINIANSAMTAADNAIKNTESIVDTGTRVDYYETNRCTVPEYARGMAQISKLYGGTRYDSSYKSKNLMPFPYDIYGTSETDDFKFIVNSDGSVRAVGKTGNSQMTFSIADSVTLEPSYTYVLSGDLDKESEEFTNAVSIPMPYRSGSEHVTNGITFTMNDDGSIVANGTATDDAYYYLTYYDSDLIVPNALYKVSGCPSGGADNKYKINVYHRNLISLIEYYGKDYGDGLVFEVSGGYGDYWSTGLLLSICISKGNTVTDLVFKPSVEEILSVSKIQFKIGNKIYRNTGANKPIVISGVSQITDVKIVIGENVEIDQTFYPMIEEGDVPTKYVQSFSHYLHANITGVTSSLDGNQDTSIVIPESIQNIEGYGWGLNTKHNYVDFENNTFHKQVDRLSFAGVMWSEEQRDEYNRYFVATFPAEYEIPYASPKEWYSNANIDDITFNYNTVEFLCNDTAYSDYEDFVEALDYELYFEINLPNGEFEIITEIQPFDNFIPISPGGMISYENLNAACDSSIIYYKSEVASSSDRANSVNKIAENNFVYTNSIYDSIDRLSQESQNIIETTQQQLEDARVEISNSNELYVKEYVDGQEFVNKNTFDQNNLDIDEKFGVTNAEVQSNYGDLNDKIGRTDDDVKKLNEKFTNYFTFDVSQGLVIHSPNDEFQVIVGNSEISFWRNGNKLGYWDGEDLYTGNIDVELHKRARFGNFAFVPRSNKNLSLKYVGEGGE